MPGQNILAFRWRTIVWIVAGLTGAFQAWTYRFWIEPDGVNYLDIAAAYLRHDWTTAINPYWSPLYSWLLTAPLALSRFCPYWESTLLHVLNFLVFLCVLWCGEFLIAELISARRQDALPCWVFWLIGYSVLFFVGLFMISVYLDTPDLCVSALVYLATGLLLRIHSTRASRTTFILFGIVLGVAYLAKTIMFLIAFAFLLVAGRNRRIVLSAACFVAISLPWIILLSHAQRRITYGDAGWANYCFYVASSGLPIHSPRILLARPEIREFSVPIRATYPPWFNPIYWIEGIRPRFDLRAQVAAVRTTTKEYVHELLGQKEFVAAFIVLLAFSRGRIFQWRILLPALTAIVLYGLVHAETRLVGSFVAIIWLVLFSGLCVSRGRLAVWVSLAVVSAGSLRITKAVFEAPVPTAHVEWSAASALHRLGLVPGSHVAYFGHTNEADYWAHLAGLQVSADLQKEDTMKFWSTPASLQEEVFTRLADAGIKAILTKSEPTGRWQRIYGTPYAVLLLDRQ